MTVTSEDHLLEIEEVTVRFGGLVALRDVDVSVAPRRVVGVIGPNGAGKTTLFNVVCGFVRPDEGRLRWRGRSLRNHQAHKLAELRITRTLQGLGLFPGLTVRENVMTGATRHARSGVVSALMGSRRSDRDECALAERAAAALEDLDVASYANRLPGQLPYGIQKRVALARALVADPELLMLDEPASGLSSAEMDELAEHIRGLRDRMAVMLVEHHMDLVMSVCDEIVVLNFGQVIATGTPDEIRANPLVAEAYLGDPAEETAHA
jgi:branched-chain amino acid transport system ATP-binding protein